MDSLRIGHGYDVHRLVEGRPLIIGGVIIPYDKGLDGHSDADVLLHAIADALLGAASLPDIGQLYPPNDPKYLNADSSELLADVYHRIWQAGFKKVINLDCIVMAEAPRINPYVPQMRKRIAEILYVHEDRVGIKATTTETLGFVGRGEGIAASAVCLITSDG
jgi:2-C-methyl-D-erythritol 2,4-cyclodiphosphate synthase